MKKITVVGAGFSGLTLALELAKLGFAVEVLEKSSRVGGLIHTAQTSLGLVETAANALMLDDNVHELMEELRIEAVRPLASAKKRFIFRDRPRRWPLSFTETIQFTRRVFFHLLTRGHFIRPQKRESVFQWGQRNLGYAATQFFVGPALQGIYAGDTHKLSSYLILSPLFQKKRRRYRGLVTGRNGMQDVIDALEKRLIFQGVSIHKETEFTWNLEPTTATVIATSARAAAQILLPKDPKTSHCLSKIEMASLMTVTTFWKNSSSPYKGFGCLVPRSEGLRSLGILINSTIFPGRDQVHSETFIFGGATDPGVLSLSDGEVKDLVQTERQQIFGVQDPLREAIITRWPAALPHYDIDLEQILEEISLPENIYLHGNYLGGIGLTKILAQSKKLAREIKQKYG